MLSQDAIWKTKIPKCIHSLFEIRNVGLFSALDGAVLTVSASPHSGLAGPGFRLSASPAGTAKMPSWIHLSSPRALGASPPFNLPLISPCEFTAPHGSSFGEESKGWPYIHFLFLLVQLHVQCLSGSFDFYQGGTHACLLIGSYAELLNYYSKKYFYLL